jgi:hypothetical protein
MASISKNKKEKNEERLKRLRKKFGFRETKSYEEYLKEEKLRK